MRIPDDDYSFDKDMAVRLRELSGPAPTGLKKWRFRQIICCIAQMTALLYLLSFVPNRFFNPDVLHITIAIGMLGTWRFGWWFTHAVRAEIYRRLKWPGMRHKADTLWQKGWRPRRLHIQMTTYHEEPAITKRVIGAILSQIRREGIPTSIWVGTGASYDEEIIRDFIETHGADIPDDLAELTFVRQNQPGKRMAIGLVLRAISRHGIEKDDLVIFMDGDAIFGNNVLEKTCSMFGADPDLQALTTNEEVVCYGPAWIQSWLSMRFAQRRLAMQSHALSEKVLTLTGRMSVFRAKNIVDEKFIRTIEADHLDHWLWGRFRFLSGDDKSTWYHMLTCGAKMIYVPDACVYTVEVIEGQGLGRMVQNFRRWSGNMLRNGSRAIALGPRKIKLFIWWCVVDQRIAMWTMMVSPVLAILATFLEPAYLWSSLIWITSSRFVLCLFLFRYSRSIDLSWTYILYFNQIINACVKIYMIYHLNKQKWSNRGNQSSGHSGAFLDRCKAFIAMAQLLTAVTGFVLFLSIWVGLVTVPWVF